MDSFYQRKENCNVGFHLLFFMDTGYAVLGSVWIQLKTEKHCSKIIFKYVNSTVGPIFNEKVAEK